MSRENRGIIRELKRIHKDLVDINMWFIFILFLGFVIMGIIIENKMMEIVSLSGLTLILIIYNLGNYKEYILKKEREVQNAYKSKARSR